MSPNDLSRSCLIRPPGDNFKIVYNSEERMFHDYLSSKYKRININACTTLHWYYAAWHSFNLRKQENRKHEIFSAKKKASKDSQLITDSKTLLELEYIMYIWTDVRELSEVLHYQKDTINKTINLFLDPSIWNHTDPATGKKIGILTDESWRKSEYHKAKILSYNPLIKRNRWLLFHPEVYNNYASSLSIAEDYIKEKKLDQYYESIEPYFEKKHLAEGWTPPVGAKKTEAKTKTEKIPSKTPKLKVSWSDFLSWSKSNRTERTYEKFTELEAVKTETGYNVSNADSLNDIQRITIEKYFGEHGLIIIFK